MKITDLKVGNYIMTTSGRIESVLEITKEIVKITSDSPYEEKYHDLHYKHIDLLLPIEITPAILLKAGFIQEVPAIVVHSFSIDIPNSFGYNKLVFSGDYLYIRQGEKDEQRYEDDLCTLWNKDLKHNFYLHEFQNLFYFLSREELQITLPKYLKLI